MADPPRQQWQFRLGDAFPANDPVARFIVVVALGLNDTLLANELLVATDDGHDLFYFFNLASGHLWELAQELHHAHTEWQDVRQFIASLRSDHQRDFTTVIELALPGDPTGLGHRLNHLRNAFFHYPSLKRSTSERGRLPITRALRDAADQDVTLTIDRTGRRLNGIRAGFASDVLVKLMTRDYDEQELRALVQQMAARQAAYNRFSQAALGSYLRQLPAGIVTREIQAAMADAQSGTDTGTAR